MQTNEPLLSVKIGLGGIIAVHVMAYSEAVEQRADQLYGKIKRHLKAIDETLTRENKTGKSPKPRKATE